MNRDRCAVLVLIYLFIAVGFSQVGTALAGKRADHPIGSTRLRDDVVCIHNAEDGCGESPSLAVTADMAYVAFGVRVGYESHIYLSRVPRRDRAGEIVTVRLDTDGEIEFWPSACLDRGGVVYVAWTSFREGEWSIRACRVEDMQVVEEGRISLSEGFTSQVKTAVRDGKHWFTWVEWQDGTYRLMASKHGEDQWEAEGVFKVYEGEQPVARPDLHLAGADRANLVWDHYESGRHRVMMCEVDGGGPGPIEDLSGEAGSHNWGPHIAGHDNEVLITWQMVPNGSDRCQPALALPGQAAILHGIDRPADRETWRVGCFAAGDRLWVIWATRWGHRRTFLFLRSVGSEGLGRSSEIRFDLHENFINSFDCAFESDVAIVLDTAGDILLAEFRLPGPGRPGFPEGESAAEHPKMAGVTGGPERLDYTTEYEGERLRLYFGDHHSHTSFSDGRAYPDMAMLFGRDVRGLDYICITDHDMALTPGEFAWNNAVADYLTENGRYVCLHGYEPSHGWAEHGFGHWNLLLPGDGDVFQFEEGMTPRALQEYSKEHDALLIPHHVAKRFAPYDWDYFDPDAEAVVEMCSVHGIFETYSRYEGRREMVQGNFIEDALARGLRFGFVGASDFHNCFRALQGEVGLTGVYAASLAAGPIFDAYRRRRTFALTGGRIALDFRCNGRFMGEEIVDSEALSFEAYAVSPDSIVLAEIVSDGRAIFRLDPADAENLERVSPAGFRFNATVESPDSTAYFYLRVQTAKGDRAWSSPIWSVRTP